MFNIFNIFSMVQFTPMWIQLIVLSILGLILGWCIYLRYKDTRPEQNMKDARTSTELAGALLRLELTLKLFDKNKDSLEGADFIIARTDLISLAARLTGLVNNDPYSLLAYQVIKAREIGGEGILNTLEKESQILEKKIDPST